MGVPKEVHVIYKCSIAYSHAGALCSLHVLLAAANHIAYYVPLMFDSAHGYW